MNRNVLIFGTSLFIFSAIFVSVIAGFYFYTQNNRSSDKGSNDTIDKDNLLDEDDMIVNEQTVDASQVKSVTLKTSKGDIKLELFYADAPKTVKNFVDLASEDFYDGTIFHRVIPDFIIQGGDPTGTGYGGPGYKFEDEINQHKMVEGVIAMANSGPNTNGSQFFIVTDFEYPHLDGKHTVFGKVIEGMDIVKAISLVERDYSDKPLQDIIIEDVVIE